MRSCERPGGKNSAILVSQLLLLQILFQRNWCKRERLWSEDAAAADLQNNNDNNVVDPNDLGPSPFSRIIRGKVKDLDDQIAKLEAAKECFKMFEDGCKGLRLDDKTKPPTREGTGRTQQRREQHRSRNHSGTDSATHRVGSRGRGAGATRAAGAGAATVRGGRPTTQIFRRPASWRRPGSRRSDGARNGPQSKMRPPDWMQMRWVAWWTNSTMMAVKCSPFVLKAVAAGLEAVAGCAGATAANPPGLVVAALRALVYGHCFGLGSSIRPSRARAWEDFSPI